MAKKMKALRKLSPEAGGVLTEVDIPSVKPGYALVKIEVAAICGSDLQVYNWRSDMASKVNLPITMGHEYCGKVVEVGSGVDSLAVGDLVAGETHFPCGNCYLCSSGKQHNCVDMKLVGRTFDGCFAEYMLVPEICLRKVPVNVDKETAAMFEPLGVAVHAIQETAPCGETVLVIGCGPIGLMTAAVAKKMGASRVFAASRTQEKLDLAVKLGADKVINSGEQDLVDAIKEVTRGEGVDVVIEASGSTDAMIQGLDSLKKHGRFCLVGVPKDKISLNADHYLIRRGLQISGVFGRRMFDTWITLEELVDGSNLDLNLLKGSSYSLDDYKQAFEKANTKPPERIFLTP